MLGLTVLQISLRRCALGLSHPTRAVRPAGHWLFPSHIQGGNRSFLWDLSAVPALLIAQFIVGHTSFLRFLPTAEKLRESLLGRCVLQQDWAYLSLLMLFTVLPSPLWSLIYFSVSNSYLSSTFFWFNEPKVGREFSVHSRTIEEQTPNCGWGWDPQICFFLTSSVHQESCSCIFSFFIIIVLYYQSSSLIIPFTHKM